MTQSLVVFLVASSAFAAAPRGLEFATQVDAVTQIDSRLADWMKNKGDRKALLATRAEIEAQLKPLAADAKELKKLTNEELAAQKLGKLPAKFSPSKVLVDPLEREGLETVSLELIFIEGEGKMACQVSLMPLPGKRWVLSAGPVCMEAPMEKLMKSPHKTLFEKQGTGWVAAPAP